MTTINEAARRVAARELATQRKVQTMALDPSNPPAQPDAQQKVEEVAKALGVDPTDGDAMTKALASLLEAAGAGADATPQSTESVEEGLRAFDAKVAKAKGWTPAKKDPTKIGACEDAHAKPRMAATDGGGTSLFPGLPKK